MILVFTLAAFLKAFCRNRISDKETLFQAKKFANKWNRTCLTNRRVFLSTAQWCLPRLDFDSVITFSLSVQLLNHVTFAIYYLCSKNKKILLISSTEDANLQLQLCCTLMLHSASWSYLYLLKVKCFPFLVDLDL